MVRNLRVPSRAVYEHIVYDSHLPDVGARYLLSRACYLALCVLPLLVSSHLGVKLPEDGATVARQTLEQ